jgi:hypothetical protein
MRDIERKLRVEICPYIVTAQILDRWWPYRTYVVYSYVGEIFVLLAGFGFANPVITFLSDNSMATAPNHNQATVATFLQGSQSGWIALMLLVIWGLVKFYIGREDLEKRCSLLSSCKLQFRQLENQLRKVLADPKPMEKLLELQLKLVELVDRNIAEESWQYNGPAPDIDPLVERYCADLVATFSPFWEPEPSHQRSVRLEPVSEVHHDG